MKLRSPFRARRGSAALQTLLLLSVVGTVALSGFFELGAAGQHVIAGESASTLPQVPNLGSRAHAGVASAFSQAGDAARRLAGDVGTSSPARLSSDVTLQTYERRLAEYIDGTPQEVSADAQAWIAATLDRVSPEQPILEIGSGFGRDADFIEAHGFAVTRSDAAQSFVDLLRAQGHDALSINALSDDVRKVAGKQSAIFANAVLLHFDDAQLEVALTNMRRALEQDGVLSFAVKRGDGEEWSQAKLGEPRYFRYWQRDTLYPLLEKNGFKVEWDLESDAWLHVVARNKGLPEGVLGDLRAHEVTQIQAVVDEAGRSLHVVGSAAEGIRREGSDIDYVVPPSSRAYFAGLETKLPGMDPDHGMLIGVQNPHIGPGIQFEPGAPPRRVDRVAP